MMMVIEMQILVMDRFVMDRFGMDRFVIIDGERRGRGSSIELGNNTLTRVTEENYRSLWMTI